MIALLGVLLVVTVSGDEQVTGILGESVLLPCSCSDRNITKPIKWQFNEDFILFKNENNESNFKENYKDRARVLLEGNCSLFLTHVRKEDRGKYKCICHIGETYKDFPVNLTVVAHFHICQTAETVISPNEKIFNCTVNGYDQEAKIQWSSDGQQLTNSSETTITHTPTLDGVNGSKTFHSKLVTNISNPKCYVKTDGIENKFTESCSVGKDQILQEIQGRSRYFIIIPFVMAAGLFVVLWCS